MKSLRVILFALVLPAAACGGSHDSSSTASSATEDASAVLSTVPKAEPDPIKPIAIEDKGPQSEVKAEAPIEIPAKFSDALALGKALSAKGDARAKEVLEAAAKMDKKSAEPHIELARMYIAKGERGLAIKSANKAVKLAPTSSQAYNTLGRAELARYDYDKAIAAFRQATELNPDNTWAWNNLGFAHLQLKQYSDAIEALKVAVEKKDATGYMFNNLGTAYEQLDQLDEARDAFESGAKLGSVEAKQSRKRLEGVDSIAMYKEPAAKPEEKTYDNVEEMPADDVEEPMVEDRQPDVKVEEPAKVEAPKTEEPAKTEVPAVPAST